MGRLLGLIVTILIDCVDLLSFYRSLFLSLTHLRGTLLSRLLPCHSLLEPYYLFDLVSATGLSLKGICGLLFFYKFRPSSPTIIIIALLAATAVPSLPI